MVNFSAAPIPDQKNQEFLSYQKIFESQPGLILVTNPDLYIIAATDSLLKETLSLRENFIGKHLSQAFRENPEAVEATLFNILKPTIDKVQATGEPHQTDIFRFDKQEIDKPGSFFERYWQTSLSPLKDDTGKINYLIFRNENVTEAVKANLQLKKSLEREAAALAQAQLQRDRLERLFAQAPAAMAILDGPDLIFNVVNQAYQDLFVGRNLVGLPIFQALPELKDQPIAGIIRKVYATGETFEGKEILVPVARTPEGPLENIYWSFIYQALFDARGQVSGILIFSLDVTNYVKARLQVEKNATELKYLNQKLQVRVERRTSALEKAQAEAERQRQRLENLFLQAPAPICILNGPNLIYELVNPSYEKLFPGRQLLGKPILEVLPEIENHVVYKTFRQVYETGITYEEPEIGIPLARPADGVVEDRYFRYIQQARRNEAGEIDGVLVFAFEITEQVLARQAVEASAQRLRLVTDALPVLISYLDREEKYHFVNKAYEPWFNLKSEEIVGRPIRELIGEKAYENTKDYIARALAGERLNFEASMPYRENFKKHIQTSYVPDVQEGQVLGFYTLVNDVTEQVLARQVIEKSEQQAKELAAELAKANEELWVANQEIQSTNEELGIANQQLQRTNIDLDNFIYTASHDLKTPIINIESLVQALAEDLPPESLAAPDTRYTFKLILDSVQRFKRTIDHLTEITKLQKENSTEPFLVNLEQLVSEVQLDLAPAINTAQALIEVDVQNCPTIRFSEKNLRSIIYNLLSNAVKYRSPDRAPEVKIICQGVVEYTVLTVQDNGLGLNQTQVAKLFGMFQRLHSHVEGTGIGLYMVKRMVENAGGKIEVKSQEGEGTEFRVYFRK